MAERCSLSTAQPLAPIDFLRQWPTVGAAAAAALLRLPSEREAASLKQQLNSRLLSDDAENVTFLPPRFKKSKPSQCFDIFNINTQNVNKVIVYIKSLSNIIPVVFFIGFVESETKITLCSCSCWPCPVGSS